MTFKSLFTFRKAAVQGGQHDDAGMIVILMMALVFVPIIVAHAAMLWQDSLADIAQPQIAAIVNMIVPAF